MFEGTALYGVWHVFLAGFLGFTTLGFSFYRNCIIADKIFEEERKKMDEEYERRKKDLRNQEEESLRLLKERHKRLDGITNTKRWS
ncbi:MULTISPECIES: hypothetical protein [unclassified Bacillus cereus group]|uniref:hypothetical protein n=1 Tax=unclassified Bacillus cereus group TaxID=2750818 RepID=UPI0029C15F57|nr:MULTISPECIES: hypothetical protein [unclassified Bacillus cereus group]MDX5880815.1 hypothetical protein [Bacillus cereus group sp. BfR-BA-01042]MDX5906669.1 hypothetical protein [Bacillus cereus group sp. BfR-BA-01048]